MAGIEADMDRPIFINFVLGLEVATLRDDSFCAAKHTYCNTIGVEFVHIQDPEQRHGSRTYRRGTKPHRIYKEWEDAIYDVLFQLKILNNTSTKICTGTKRFGLDGGEAVDPALEQIFKRGGLLGIREIVLGMAHRGRLNVLHPRHVQTVQSDYFRISW